MPLTDALRILFVINPVSGDGDRNKLLQAIHDYFRDSPHNIEFYELKGGGEDQSSIRYWISSWRPDRVTAVGGDGTLKAVAEALAGSELPIGLIPAGSANGMAKELGIPKEPEACLDIITGTHIEAVDMIRINDRSYCLHLSDLGLNARLIKHFEESDRRGMWGYARELWKVIRGGEQFAVTIRAGGQTIHRKAWMVVLANARMYGTGAVINPEGEVRDGLLELIILRQLSFWELLKMLASNRRFNPRKTEIIRARRAELNTQRSVHFQIDGEYIGPVRRVSAEVHPGVIRMLLPQDQNKAPGR